MRTATLDRAIEILKGQPDIPPSPGRMDGDRPQICAAVALAQAVVEQRFGATVGPRFAVRAANGERNETVQMLNEAGIDPDPVFARNDELVRHFADPAGRKLAVLGYLREFYTC